MYSIILYKYLIVNNYYVQFNGSKFIPFDHRGVLLGRCLKKKEICTGARELCDRRRIFPQEYFVFQGEILKYSEKASLSVHIDFFQTRPRWHTRSEF